MDKDKPAAADDKAAAEDKPAADAPEKSAAEKAAEEKAAAEKASAERAAAEKAAAEKAAKDRAEARKRFKHDDTVLAACRYFDRTGAGYIRSDDLRRILHCYGASWPLREVRDLVAAGVAAVPAGSDPPPSGRCVYRAIAQVERSPQEIEVYVAELAVKEAREKEREKEKEREREREKEKEREKEREKEKEMEKEKELKAEGGGAMEA